MMNLLKYIHEKQFVFFLLTPLHICFFLLLPQLARDFSITDFFILYFFWFVFGCVGIEVGYHRYFSHNSFKASPAMENLLAIIGIWGAQWSPIWWKSLHVLHHKEADGLNDPHSPQKGFLYSLISWYLIYNPQKVPLRSARALLRSPIQNFIHKHYLVLFWLPIAVTLVFSPKYGAIIFVFPAILSFWQENLINSICHVGKIPFNYRNFNVDDKSRNNLLLGYFIWGAGFHNNHHKDPSTYSFSRKKFEFDLCKPTVKTLLFVEKILSSKKYFSEKFKNP